MSDTAEDRGDGEQADTDQEEPTATGHVTEPAHAGDHGGDGYQIRDDDPLDLLKRGIERLRQRRQAHIGDARSDRGQQHG